MSFDHDDPGILLELTPCGHAMQVAAVDERTGIEIRLVVPKSAGIAEIRQLARRKLVYVLSRDFEKPKKASNPPSRRSLSV